MKSFLLALMMLPIAVLGAKSDSPVRNAEMVPPRQWVAWSPDDIASFTSSGKQSDKSLSDLLDGKPSTAVILPKLKNGRIGLEFKTPRNIGQLAFVQGRMGDWALPMSLRLTVDGRDAGLVTLENAPGKIQSVLLNEIVGKLEIEVVDVYTDEKRRQSWGGFSGIGEALFGATEVSFEGNPLQEQQRNFLLTVDTPVDTQAKASFTLGRGKRNLHFNFPELSLKAGTHAYPLAISDLVPEEAYGYQIHSRHLEKFFLEGMDATIPVRLISLTPVEEALEEAPWESIPDIAFPTREINGEVWTEGHSYRTVGRFGNSTYNGMVNDVVSGNWLRVYTANSDHLLRRQDFDFHIEGFESDSTDSTGELWRLKRSAWDPEHEKVEANWTTMTLERLGKDGDAARITTGLLAPGFLIDTPKPLSFSSRGGGSLPFRSGAPDEEEGRFIAPAPSASGKPAIGPSAILTSRGLITKPGKIDRLEEPWFVAIWGIAKGGATFWGDEAVAILFTADTKAPIDWSTKGLLLPPDQWGISSAFNGLFNAGWDVDKVTERARLLTRMLRTYPVDCREYYRVVEDEVLIHDEFSYLRWGNPAWQMADYAPIPPIYSWARDSIDWQGIPEGSEASQKANIATPVGPFRWVEGDSLSYELPRIASRHAAWPRRDEFSPVYDAMATEIAAKAEGFTGARPNNHPWVIAYHHNWSHGLLGGSFHNPEALQSLLNIAKPNAERLYAPSSWIVREELFTKEPYQIYGWLDMSTLPIMFGDPNSNVGQAAYSLYLYALYSGDWDLVRSYWPRVMETVRIFEVLNDWAVPGTTSREAVKYGSIDMDTIAYAGVTAMLRMAEVLGETKDAERLAYLQTKIAAATALRLNFTSYLDPENKYPHLYCIGFAEDGPALERSSPNSTRGLDKIAMCLTWTGEMPEMYDFLINILGVDFLTSFQRDFMDVYFSGWRNMSHNQVRSAAHIANRSWLPDWPRESLEDDLRIWLENYNKTAAPYSTAGMFGAYTAHETGVYLVGWEPARFINSKYDATRRILSVELENDAPFELVVHSPTAVETLMIDGRPGAIEEVVTEGDFHRLRLNGSGKIQIGFSTAP